MVKTDKVQAMLREIINNLSAFKIEVFKRFDEVDKRFVSFEEKLTKKIDGAEQRLTARIDSIGKQVAYLEDDAPTREEFNILEKRVGKLEQKPSSAV